MMWSSRGPVTVQEVREWLATQPDDAPAYVSLNGRMYPVTDVGWEAIQAKDSPDDNPVYLAQPAVIGRRVYIGGRT